MGKSSSMSSGTGTMGLFAGSAVAGGVSSAGGTTITSCPADDKSFYCQFIKGFNLFKMILFIIAFIIAIYVLYKMFVKK